MYACTLMFQRTKVMVGRWISRSESKHEDPSSNARYKPGTMPGASKLGTAVHACGSSTVARAQRQGRSGFLPHSRFRHEPVSRELGGQ